MEGRLTRLESLSVHAVTRLVTSAVSVIMDRCRCCVRFPHKARNPVILRACLAKT